MSGMTRRRFGQVGAKTAACVAMGGAGGAGAGANFTLEIGPYVLEASPKHRIRTVAYNGQVPGPLLRMKEGREVSVVVRNLSPEAQVVHWHGLFLPPEVDGAM